jgi:hypothetical protein
MRRAKSGRRPTLAWIFEWPPLFITAFVVSTQLHDPAAEVPGSLSLLNGVATGELVASFAGVAGVIIWIVGWVVLAFLDS